MSKPFGRGDREHVPDKLAASKRKATWMSGVIPLGYQIGLCHEATSVSGTRRHLQQEADEPYRAALRTLFKMMLKDFPGWRWLKPSG
jgi:hypothetical protein